MIDVAGRFEAGTVGWHVTEARNVGAIKRWGLIPRDTAKHHYPDEAYGHHGIEGVFITLGETWWVLRANSRMDGALLSHAIKVDVSGLLYGRDLYISHARCVMERITPDRILECVRR